MSHPFLSELERAKATFVVFVIIPIVSVVVKFSVLGDLLLAKANPYHHISQ